MRGWKADATPNGKCAASLRVTKEPDFSFLLLLLLLRALGPAGLELGWGWAQIFRGRFVLARQGGRGRRGGGTTTTTTTTIQFLMSLVPGKRYCAHGLPGPSPAHVRGVNPGVWRSSRRFAPGTRPPHPLIPYPPSAGFIGIYIYSKTY